MIGAMPAIAVRGKNKADGSIGFISRPHKLSLHFRPPLTHHQVTPTPSPVNSPPGVGGAYSQSRERARHRFARNFLNKRCIFTISVLAPLVGLILLFIGLIQLTPGAEANSFGVPLIIAGSAALVTGLLVIIMRLYFTWELSRLSQRRNDVPQIKVNEPSVTEQDVEKGINTSMAADLNLNPSTQSPPAPNANANGEKNKPKDNDKEQGQGGEETSKLLQDKDVKINIKD